MRITFLLPSDNLTGGNRVVAIYAQQLVARGKGGRHAPVGRRGRRQDNGPGKALGLHGARR